MNDIDPFANVETNDREKIVITIKAGNSSDPWVVYHAKDNAEAADLIGASEAVGLFAILAAASDALKGHFNAGQTLGATPVQAPAAAQEAYQTQGAPQYQTQPQQAYQAPQATPAGPPPGMPTPTCPHGVKNFVPSGISKATNKPYSAFWGCPAQQSDASKCRPEWVK